MELASNAVVVVESSLPGQRVPSGKKSSQRKSWWFRVVGGRLRKKHMWHIQIIWKYIYIYIYNYIHRYAYMIYRYIQYILYVSIAMSVWIIQIRNKDLWKWRQPKDYFVVKKLRKFPLPIMQKNIPNLEKNWHLQELPGQMDISRLTRCRGDLEWIPSQNRLVGMNLIINSILLVILKNICTVVKLDFCVLKSLGPMWTTLKTLMTFHGTDWFIGILKMAHYNPDITGCCNPLIYSK